MKPVLADTALGLVVRVFFLSFHPDLPASCSGLCCCTHFLDEEPEAYEVMLPALCHTAANYKAANPRPQVCFLSHCSLH